MNIAILGFGSQGESCLEYFRTQGGHQVTVCDRSESTNVPDGVETQLGENYLENLDRFDLVVRAPSIHPKDIVKANGTEILSKVTSNTNLFFEACPSRNIIGVTGTKGKGTTSTLIAGMLKSAGFQVHLGGNIGTPPLEMLKDGIKKDDWVVLELANFQLIDIKHSPPIAVCLMVEPEHQDWHTNVDEYVEAKQQLFRWQKWGDTAIHYARNALSTLVASASRGRKLAYFGETGARIESNYVVMDGTHICRVEEIKLFGEHNWQNVCAAVTAVWQVTRDREAIAKAITSETGLPFRIEFIRESNGVRYFNDSFGTTPETAIVAIEAFSEPKVIILGGSDKGSKYDGLAQTVADGNVRSAIIIGKTGPAIEKCLKDTGFDRVVHGGGSMEEIVKLAASEAEPGDVVLLSTASASFDMFKDYKDRGEKFNEAVRSLP